MSAHTDGLDVLAGMLKQRGVLNLGRINYPNLMLDFDPPPSGRKRPIIAIAAAPIRQLLEKRA